MTDHDRSDSCLLVLTRPIMFKGVPIEGAVANFFATFVGGMLLSDHTLWRSPFMFWLASIPIHMVMKQAVSKDYHAFRTAWLWLLTVGIGVLESLPTERPRSGKGCASSV